MQRFDIALKEILRTPASLAATQLAGSRIKRWLDPHQPKTKSPQADLVGETYGGSLVHLEIQSSNDPKMPRRMFEYCSGLFERTGKLPHQVLVYVGREPLRMVREVGGPDFSYRYTMFDIRELDGEKLIGSRVLGDNVIAILARLRNQREALHEILARILSQPQPEREKAQAQLMALAGLRRLEVNLEEEAERMPITIDLMENRVIGPKLRQQLAKGRAQGQAEVIRRLLTKRFGRLPAWAVKKIEALTPRKANQVAERLLDAASLEELFG
jgi:hypothetical protein